MITREEAIKLLHKNMQSQNLRRHCYAVEAVMLALARKFQMPNSKCQIWGIVGLLHDGDYEKTKDAPEKHTILMAEWLKDMGENNPEIQSAILSHNFSHTGENSPKNNLEWSLYCCDELTGLIVAVALVRPDRKLSSVTIESIMNKWNQKSFAAGVKREQIEKCEEKLGIGLEKFIDISLSAMQEIHQELGL